MHLTIKYLILASFITIWFTVLQSAKIGYLPNSNFKNYHTIGPKKCAKECLQHPRCQSLNYDQERYYCELNYGLKGNVSLLTENRGNFLYIEKKDISNQLKGVCASADCSTHTRCVPHNKMFSCIPIGCGTPPSINNGSVPSRVYNFDEEANYTCNDGFWLVGSKRRCTSNGDWTNNNVNCVLICQVPKTDVPFVIIRSREQEVDIVGSVRKLKCATHRYYISGTKNITCVEDGSWSSVELVCQGCGNPPKLAGATYTFQNAKRGTTLNYSCTDGYKSSGDVIKEHPSIICQTDDTWSTFSHTCLVVDCGPPPKYPNTNVKDGTTYIGDYRNYTCATGYEEEEEAQILCDQNKKWLNVTESNCQRVSCGSPPEYEGAAVDLGFNLYNYKRTYSCVSGYENSNEQTPYVVCGSDKHWIEYIKPNCTMIGCGPPPSLEGVQYDGYNDSYFGDLRMFSCLEGYVAALPSTKEENDTAQERNSTHENNITRENVIKCHLNGSWSGPANCTRFCPGSYTWDQESLLCFKYFETKVTWYDANRICSEEYNDTLARVNSVTQLQTIMSYLPDSCDVWVGEHSYKQNKTKLQTQYSTIVNTIENETTTKNTEIDETTDNRENVSSSPVITTPGQNCLAARLNALTVVHSDCSNELWFICEKVL